MFDTTTKSLQLLTVSFFSQDQMLYNRLIEIFDNSQNDVMNLMFGNNYNLIIDCEN